MNGRLAAYIFTGGCALLALFLFLKLLPILVSGILFAVLLVILGIVSNGFRRK